MKNIKYILGFTLVELIVVITIVGILSTVGFVSYSGYLAGARDSNRFSQLTKLSDSLQVYAATKSLPLPDDYIEVTASGTVIAYQGYVGVDVLETIDYTNGGKDPKDGSYYTYYVTKARNSMQLLAFMEEQSSVTNISQTFSADYTERVPKVYGKKLGVLTEVTSNTPIQEVSGLTTLDIVTTTDLYVSHLSDDKKLEGDGTVLQASIPNGSCKRIKQMGKNKGSGIYTINPAGMGEFQVYCDMDTKGGGWTAATILADITTQNLFDTGNTEKVTSITQDISSKGTLSDIWRDNDNKDIMLKCSTDNTSFKAYEKAFIIYSFPKAAINNLEKQNKESTVFSPSPLRGSWNNYEYTFGVNYNNSSYDPSMYIKYGGAGNCFAIYSGTTMYLSATNNADAQKCPSYGGGSPSNQLLGVNNYCVSYIR